MRVGFLGAGLIATFHSKMIRVAGVDVERTGVFDADPSRADAFAAASGHVVCASEDEVLDGCDAVYICTWTSEHPRLVSAAAARGLHVFCEKPLATTLGGAEAMLDAVTAAGVTHQVGLVLRRSPAFVWARHLIQDPAAGPVMGVALRDDQYLPTQGMYGSTWRADVAKAGAGTLLEHSIHDLDLLRHLVGEVTSVSAATANQHGLDGIEDVAAVSLRFAGGALGTLLSVWHENLARPSLRRLEVLTLHRHVVVEGDDWWGPVSWTDTDGRTDSLEGEALAAAAGPMVDGPLNPDEAFLVAAAAGAPAWPDFAVGVEAHRLVDGIYRSAAAGGDAVPIGPKGATPDA
jgi:predicted dehydrogenase